MNHADFVETLETRRLFAVTLADGLLTVEGTGLNDAIAITARGATLTVRVGSDRTAVNRGDVDEVRVAGLAGNDRINLCKLTVHAVVDGGDGNDRITGGQAEDILTGGAGNDVMHGGSGDDLLFGSAGNDRLFGDAGDDELTGNEGLDFLAGGTGADMTDNFPDLVGHPAGFGHRFPLDTSGFNIRPGVNVISPLLSTAPAGNQVTFDPFTGVTLSAGGAFITLPGTGAFGRELGHTPGNIIQGWFAGT